MLTSDSKSTALSAELRAHQKEWDYYSRLMKENGVRFFILRIIKIWLFSFLDDFKL
jgi:hypothetical protein